MRRVIGIDPGLDGGIALFGPEGLSTEVMPTVGKESREVDAVQLARLVRGWTGLADPIDHVFIEKVGARPGQGVVSMFSFGQGYGVLKGVFAALGIPMTLVTPQTWQRAVLLGLGKGDPKGAALVRARQLFPQHCFRASDRSRVDHQGMVDAALIAEYGHKAIGE